MSDHPTDRGGGAPPGGAAAKAGVPASSRRGAVRRRLIQLAERNRMFYVAKVVYQRRRADVFLVSFPKCGRTWLRAMLGFALADHAGIKPRNPIRFTAGKQIHPDLPRILARHDDAPHNKPASAVMTDKRGYRGRRVILLVRDPRDIVVSWYLHVTHRQARPYAGDISDFVRDRVGSLASLLAFYDAWAAQRATDAVLIVRYEDMQTDAAGELRRVLDFVGLAHAGDDVVVRAVERASFERLQKAERTGKYRGRALSTNTAHDAESFKVRRGKVGGYVDYLSDADIDYIDTAVAASPGARRFGYAGPA